MTLNEIRSQLGLMTLDLDFTRFKSPLFYNHLINRAYRMVAEEVDGFQISMPMITIGNQYEYTIGYPNIGGAGELIVDGGFETWTSPTDLTSWTETLAGSSTVTRDNTQERTGQYCLSLIIDGSNSLASVYQDIIVKPSFQALLNIYSKSSNGTATYYITIQSNQTSNYFNLTTGLWQAASAQNSFIPGLSYGLNTIIFVPESLTTSVRITIARLAATSATLWFDDSSLMQFVNSYGTIRKIDRVDVNGVEAVEQFYNDFIRNQIAGTVLPTDKNGRTYSIYSILNKMSGQSIVLYPTPSASGQILGLLVRIIPKFGTLTNDTDYPILEEGYQDAILYKAAMSISRDNKYTESMYVEYRDNYFRLKNNIIEHYNSKIGKDSVLSMKIPTLLDASGFTVQ